MTEPAAPEVVAKKKRGLSVVWIIPIVAAVIAGWIWVKALQERGPLITVSFETAEGLEAGKTQVQFREVSVGVVEQIDLKPDLSGVIVGIRMGPHSEDFLTEGTRFWVVRPRVGAAGVSGLGTLLSGAYIEVDPSAAVGGTPTLEFVGLELPPVTPADAPGLKLTLEAPILGSLSIGSPLYYHDVEIGWVERHRLAEDEMGVEVDAYVEEPYEHLIRENTRFWNASGIAASLSADGFEIRAESLDALLRGGIDCETPPAAEAGGAVQNGHRFTLYANAEAARDVFTVHEPVVMFFDGSVRGLQVGAPVEFRGIKLGEVTSVELDFDRETLEVRIPVVAELHPERLKGTVDPRMERVERFNALIERGLRARLASGSLVTGALYVEFDLFPATEARLLGHELYDIEIPTLPSTTAELQQAVGELPEIMAEVRASIESIREIIQSPETAGALDNLNAVLASVAALTGRLEERSPEILTAVEEVVGSLQGALTEVEGLLGTMGSDLREGSEMRTLVTNALSELASTMRAVRTLSDYLERHPEALLTGKGNP
jgi:paraquat-inducible protein B